MMRKIRSQTALGAAAVALTLGLTGACAGAGAADAATMTTTGATTIPVAGATTIPASGSTPTTTPGATGKAGSRVMTGREIWAVVRPRHGVNCAHAAKQITRVEAAITAATKRQGRWQIKSSVDQARRRAVGAVGAAGTSSTRAATRTAKRAKTLAGKLKGFTRLAQDGHALISRIDTKCGLASPAA
ncbi:MAG: hypothetical protein ACRDY1_15295 [Acidimicrobiales bacterium]